MTQLVDKTQADLQVQGIDASLRHVYAVLSLFPTDRTQWTSEELTAFSQIDTARQNLEWARDEIEQGLSIRQKALEGIATEIEAAWQECEDEKAADSGMSIEVVHVGTAGHLRRYKVVDAQEKYVPGGLFRSYQEAEQFIAAQVQR